MISYSNAIDIIKNRGSIFVDFSCCIQLETNLMRTCLSQFCNIIVESNRLIRRGACSSCLSIICESLRQFCWIREQTRYKKAIRKLKLCSKDYQWMTNQKQSGISTRVTILNGDDVLNCGWPTRLSHLHFHRNLWNTTSCIWK